MVVHQVIEVALMTEIRIRAVFWNEREALQYHISDSGGVEVSVERIKAMRHLADTLLVVREALFKTVHHPGRNRVPRVRVLEFSQEVECQACVVHPPETLLPVAL